MKGQGINVTVVIRNVSTGEVSAEEFSCQDLEMLAGEVQRRYGIDMSVQYIAPVLDEDYCSCAGVMNVVARDAGREYRFLIDSPEVSPVDFSFAGEDGEFQ